MKKITLLLSVLIFCGVTAAIAVPPGKTLSFDQSSLGPVAFSGTVHKDAGFSCKDCHNKGMFPKMKQGTVKITMDQIYAGELCGKCHNGTTAFAAKKSCSRCHVK
ncbi:c(7)-type cytochrome triheme domain-containing protein [uncultured Desulfuromusa sp.]|uniref:c(7)-type cytochrome triheme domain-containing protein n=1 Tax=uncultured Desulfuromusa sp. TaxID=219183 RepID=UPI002AA6087A|nr:c(7)-type cytochrome triheme domain-containing protein [uncultured Desulfuromusa sp.]